MQLDPSKHTRYRGTTSPLRSGGTETKSKQLRNCCGGRTSLLPLLHHCTNCFSLEHHHRAMSSDSFAQGRRLIANRKSRETIGFPLALPRVVLTLRPDAGCCKWYMISTPSFSQALGRDVS